MEVSILHEARQFMQEITQTSNFFEKSEKASRVLSEGDYKFVGTR